MQQVIIFTPYQPHQTIVYCNIYIIRILSGIVVAGFIKTALPHTPFPTDEEKYS